MDIFTGNISNPAPNNERESISRSEKPIGDNRARHVRRDKDTQKNITIGLYDIDEAIFIHLNRINLQVVDDGQVVKVPVLYGSPEIWVSAKRDGYLRDKQGKIMFPVMTFKRTASANDDTLKYFHRYLNVSVMKKYSTKNKYTQFSVLSNQNVPTNEVYNIVFPKHMSLTYHFIIWTEYVEQMNKLVEDITFNTNDYWGSAKGFKFRTSVDSFSHQTELQVGEDRIIKTEFDLNTHGYILPETITTLEHQKLTTEKFFTPKKFIVNMEVVATNFNLNKLNDISEKWRNQQYPNLPKSEYIPVPSPSYMRIAIVPITTTTPSGEVMITSIWHFPPPSNSSDPGYEGWISYDDDYYYIYTSGRWKRAPKVLVNAISEVIGEKKWTSYDNDYIYIEGDLDKIPMSLFNDY